MKRQPLSVTAWVLLIAALCVLLYNTATIIFAWRSPTDGLSGHWDARGFVIDAAPEASPVRPGDILAQINGGDVRTRIHAPGHWHRFLFTLPPDAITYTLLRDGSRIQLPVRWELSSLIQVLSRALPLTLVSLSFVAAAILIVLDHKPDWGAALVAIEFCLQGLNIANNAVLSLGANVGLSLTWLINPLDLFTFTLGMSFVMHVLLVFPEPKRLAQRAPRLIYAAHGLSLLLAVVTYLGIGWPDPIAARVGMFQQVLYPLAAVELLIGLGHLMHTYLTTHRPGVRNQVRWLLWGALLGPLPWLLLYNLPMALTGRPLVPLAVADFPLLLIPLSFFFSVTERGLMQVDVLIRRSLVYSGLTAFLIAFYLLLVGALKWILPAWLGVVNAELASIFAVVLIALGAAPLRMHVQKWVDRAFYRHRLDMEVMLREVGARLSTTLHLVALEALLVEEVPRRLHIAQAALLLRQADGSFRAVTPVGETAPALEPDAPLVAALAAQDAPYVLRRARPALPSVAELRRQQWELLIPLHRGGELMGIYLLGARQSGDLYGQDELAALRLLGQQSAAAVENAQLYHQNELYARNLALKVEERTRELAAANEELSEQRDRLNILLETMTDGLLVTAPDGQVTLTNHALTEMLALPAAHLTQRSLAQTLDCAPLMQAVAQAHQQPGQVCNADCAANGRVLRTSSTALRDGSGIITVVRDVTHEAAIDRMKTEFISTVSHELRTPLTSVLGFTKLIIKSLERDVMPALPPDHRKAARAMQRVLENLQIINLEGERLTSLINDVLDIAKIDAGKVEWRDQVFELSPVIAAAVDIVRPQLEKNRNTLQTILPPKLPLLLADPDRIRQVLLNLLSNATKFTEDGTLTLRVRSVSFAEMTARWRYPAENPGGVLVTVADTGSGIPESEMPNLFQRFRQLRDDVLVDKPKGTGLGLAIAKHIITHYNGVIWAESTQGVGSTFQFVLPLPVQEITGEAGVVLPPPALDVAPAAIGHYRLSDAVPTTILVVDDEAHIRLMLTQELTEAGYQVLEAANGAEGIALARRHHPALIILDVMMPDISGFDVTRLLKSDPATAPIPILILSIVEDRDYGLSLGAAAYLNKPVEAQAVLSAVARLVRPLPQPASINGNDPATDSLADVLSVPESGELHGC
ncbi:MAG TPA: ATP-binding protein [Anaerolineae bacterium]|nr:ATP-binding protein [Anaerolineae bacterium]